MADAPTQPAPRRFVGAAAGRVVRGLRQHAGLAQDALANEIGMDRTYLGRVDRGLANPTLGALSPLLKRFGVSWEAFGRLLDQELRKGAA